MVRDLARVISDPGSVVERFEFRRGEYETVASWSARAVLIALGKPQVRAVDTADGHRRIASPGGQPKACSCGAEAQLGEDIHRWWDRHLIAVGCQP